MTGITRVSKESVFSDLNNFFDTGKNPSESEPERFYHGFVLGLMVDLADRYSITSNCASGFGRYDVMLEPHDKKENVFIFEFKVYDEEDENIYQYGFAFHGKKVLIGRQI